MTKIMTTFSVWLVTSILLLLFLFMPALKDINTINSTVREKKKEISLLDQQIRAFKSAQIDLGKATRKDDILNAIVTKENLAVAIKELESAAAKTNTQEILEIRESTVKDPKASPSFTTTPPTVEQVHFDLATLNDFAGTVDFLSYLEHLPHFVEIGNIKFTAETSEGSALTAVHTGRINGQFRGVFFIRKP